MASYVWKKRVQTHYISPPLDVYLNVLTAAARQGDTELATNIFTELSARDVVFEHQHYEMLVEAYITSGDVETALSVMCVMQESKLYPNSRTTRPLFKYLSRSPDRPNEIFESLRALQHFGKRVPTAALNCVMEGAIFHQDLELAVEFYKALHEICPRGANVDTFNELLRGCHYGKRKDLALLLASELLALGLKPDNLTYDRMLIVCTNENDYEDALQYYAEMRRQRVEPRSGTLLYLIKTLVKGTDERVFGIVDDLEEMSLGAGMRTSIQRIKIWIRRNWHGDQTVMERRLSGWSA
jgi:pentatricopeptide repeat protein